MERQRSPGYPALALEYAIDAVGKIHKANRTNIISRETAAKDMGYAGLTGRSLTVLAALSQYGLVEKAGKGDLKVTRRAVEILHPIEESHRAEAVIEAAQAPALFRDLHERFSEGVPSENALRSYLIQRGFNDVAIAPAISAFLETNAYAEKAKEIGRTGPIASEPEQSASPAPKMEEKVTPAVEATPLTTLRTPPLSETELNRITMNIDGDRVLLGGVFDLKGLRLLEKKIVTLKALLTVDDDDDDDDVEALIGQRRRMADPTDPKPQLDKFKDLARELEADEDEKAFEESVRRLAREGGKAKTSDPQGGSEG